MRDIEKLIDRVEQMKLTPGDVLVVTIDTTSGGVTQDDLDFMEIALHQTVDNKIFFVPDNITLKTLPRDSISALIKQLEELRDEVR